MLIVVKRHNPCPQELSVWKGGRGLTTHMGHINRKAWPTPVLRMLVYHPGQRYKEFNLKCCRVRAGAIYWRGHSLCVHHSRRGGEEHPLTLSQVEEGVLRGSLRKLSTCPLEIEEDNDLLSDTHLRNVKQEIKAWLMR